MSIPVHVREVHRHARVARFPNGERVDHPEAAAAVVHPDLVGILEVVADVQVGRAIAGEIVEPRGQREEVGRIGERAAQFVTKARPGHRRIGELARAIIQVEQVPLGALRSDDATKVGAVLDAVLVLPLGTHLVATACLPDHLIERALCGRKCVERVPRLVGADVQVEVAVAIHIGQGQRRCGEPGGEPAFLRRIGEMTAPIVRPQLDRPAQCPGKEVEVAVAVHVGKRRAHQGQTGDRQAAGRRDVREPESPVVAVQRRRSLHRREEHVGQPVTRHVAERDAGAEDQVSVRQRTFIVDVVAMVDARGRRAQLRESGAPARRNVKRAPANIPFVVPAGVNGRRARRPGAARQPERGRPATVQGTLPAGARFTFGTSAAAALVSSKYSRAFIPMTFAVRTCGNFRM